jgi:hypothetical protein
MPIELVNNIDIHSDQGAYLLDQIAQELAETDSSVQARFLNKFLGCLSKYNDTQALWIRDALSTEAKGVVSILSSNH